MSTRVLTAKATDDILQGAAVSSSAGPETSYSNATLLDRNPGARVRYGVGTVTITFALNQAHRGDLLVIPTHDLDEGGVVLRLQNDAGLDQVIPVPAQYENGISRTIAFDIAEAVANASLRTSDEWRLVITSNTQDVVLGGAVAIYSQYREAPDFAWGVRYRKQAGVTETKNEYLSRYRVNHRTNERAIELMAGGLSATDFIDYENWFDGNWGSVLPGLLWIQRSELDPFYGTWPDTFDAELGQGDEWRVRMLFSELSKGKPLFSAAAVET